MVFADETPIDLLVRGKGRCQTAYMWIYVGGDPPYRFFEFSLNRDQEYPLKNPKGYQGVFHSGKYGTYDQLAIQKDIVWCPCFAQACRKLMEAEGGDPALRTRILRKIRYLFMFERVAWNRKPEEGLRIRQEKETPILDELTKMVKDRLLTGGLLPKPNFTKALNYYQGLAAYLPNYFTILMPALTTTWQSAALVRSPSAARIAVRRLRGRRQGQRHHPFPGPDLSQPRHQPSGIPRFRSAANHGPPRKTDQRTPSL